MHHELGTHRVVHTWAEQIRLGAEKLAHPDRRMDPAGRWDAEAGWQKWRGDDVGLTSYDAGLEGGHAGPRLLVRVIAFAELGAQAVRRQRRWRDARRHLSRHGGRLRDLVPARPVLEGDQLHASRRGFVDPEDPRSRWQRSVPEVDRDPARDCGRIHTCVSRFDATGGWRGGKARRPSAISPIE